ncbi:MAG: 30S ribosomal protein S13 [Candidatus Omnitrophica bacterium]|nr:30S ribosomal protein S13 [Candidatus Omnitrophota bacterium]
MPRILGVDVPREKRIDAALPYVYGVGRVTAKKILDEAKIEHHRRAKDLTDEEIARIAGVVQNKYIVEGDLRREIQDNIRRHMDMGSYRGVHHRRGLPVRGQRTRTNARTRKGKKTYVAAKIVQAAPAAKPKPAG